VILRAALFALIAAVGASAGAAPIRDNADLDRYLATARESPLDRFSPQARARFLADFREGRFLVPDELEAELTHGETLAILKLFDIDAVPSSMALRHAHRAIGASETPAIGASFEALHAAYVGPNSRDATLAEYRAAFAPRQSEAGLRRMSDGDVALHLRAAMIAVSVDIDTADFRDVLVDLDETDRRGITAPGWIRRVHDNLVLSRDFAAAEAFRKHHPDANLPALPPLRDGRKGRGPSVLEIGRGELVRRSIAIDRPAQVVVIAGCHFSKDAAYAIEADPALRALFSREVVWVAPAGQNPADPDLVRWNREHPLAPMATAYRESEWPLDMGAMPTFYFLRDGRVEDKVIGWRPDKVREGFRKVGLAP